MEISESDSDHSEDTDDSGSNYTEINPINDHTVNTEEVNTEEQIPGEFQEMDKEEQEKINFTGWFSLLLLRIKLRYNLSNNLFTVLLNVIYFIFLLFRHPRHMMFPKTVVDIEIITNLKVLNKIVIFAVCPNPKCSALYNSNEISVDRSGQQKPALCRKKNWGKKCSTELSFEKKLSFGKTKMVPFKTFPFLPPSEWIKTFFKQEQFLSLIKNQPEPSSTDYRDIWDGNILQQFMVDPDSMSDGRNLELQMEVEREELKEVECWPIEMLPPRRLKQRPTIEFHSELKSYLGDIHEDSLVFVEPRIDIFARCLVNGSTFSSAYNRTDQGQTALVYCVDKLNQTDAEGEVSPYFVRINFFSTARVHLKESNGVNVVRIHHLAKFHFANKDHAVDKLSGLPVLKSTFYKREHIVNVRQLIRRVAMLEVKKNYQLVSTFSR